ncbi:MAG: hypothetical protein GXY33_04920 [Phycisphaerae bacterium]|nr:hypothetical protein [Phycisphaerae bacterium]
MSKIKFKCQFCGNKVLAPGESGGKLGKCPYCQQRVYIPLPAEEVEEIPMEEVDPSEEQRKERLRQETLKLEAQLLEHREVPPSAGETRSPIPPSPSDDAPILINESSGSGEKLEGLIESYLVAMVRGELDRADHLAGQIAAKGEKAVETIDEMAMGEPGHPELRDVPQNVVAGFYRQLRKQVKG